MKRLSIFIFILATLITAKPPNILAQEASDSAVQEEEFNFNKAYEDYIYILDLYKSAHAEYLLAKAQYQQSQTLASQTKARDKTADMLQARDEVMAVYLTALRLKLAETEGVQESDRQGLYSRIDSDVAWYKNHKTQIPSAGSLEDLSNDSDEAKDHFELTEPLIYEVLTTIPIGKTDYLRNSLSNILSQTKSKTEQIRANGDHDTQKAERWIIEAEQKATRSLDKQIEAQALIYEIQDPGRQKLSSIYDKAIFRLQESHQFMKETNTYIKEIIKELVTTYL